MKQEQFNEESVGWTDFINNCAKEAITEAINNCLNNGISVTYANSIGNIIMEYSDSRKEIIGNIEKPDVRVKHKKYILKS